MTAKGFEREWIRTRAVVTCLLVLTLATGCTDVIRGTARPARNLKPKPLTGQTIKQVLLDGPALSKILDQSFKPDASLPPWFGGPDKLRRAYSVSPSRTDCLGVIALEEKTTYRSTNIKDVAGESWWHDGGSAKVISVTEGIITFPTAADANALFTKFTAQWQQCDGVTTTLPGDKISFTDTISDVRVANSVLAATVSVKSDIGGGGSGFPEARAIGVRVNCLVEVEISFYSSRRPSDQGSGDVNTSAIDIAHIMMDKISALS
jgi:hypothetical protein